MPRPTDWSPLGLAGDPTPGDPDALVAVADFMHTMAGHAQTADTGLTQVVAKSGEGAFVGKTADWLRDTISTAIRDFIGGVRTAFQQTEPAVRTYISAMREAQSRADAALTEAAGLAEDDPRRTTLTADAEQAGQDLKTAAGTAAETVREARDHIRSPNPKKSACEVFWEIFGWIVLAITVVAIFVGGPLGLIALGLNAVIAAKALIDFATGKTNITGLVLGLLGLLGPSTKPLIALSTLKTIAGATTKIVKTGVNTAGVTIAKLGNDFWHAISTITFSAVVRGIGDISATLANTIRSGSQWVFKAFTTTDGLAVRGFVTLKNFVVTFPAATWASVLTIASRVGALPPGLLASIRAVPGWARELGGKIYGGLQTVGRVLSNEFGGWKWLKIFLPLNGVEIGVLGVKDAFRLAVFGRGMLQTGRYAGLTTKVDLAVAAGGALRVSDGILRGIDPPEPGMVRTDSGLFVPRDPDGLSAVSTDLGNAPGLKPIETAGLNGRPDTSELTLPGADLAALGKSLDGLQSAPISPLRFDADSHLALPHDPGRTTLPPPAASPLISNMPVNGLGPMAAHPEMLLPPPTTSPALGSLPQHVTAPGDIGDVVSPARMAVHRADDLLAGGLPEIRALANGDITATRVSDTRIEFNLGAAENGMVLPGPGVMNGVTPNPAPAVNGVVPSPVVVNGAVPSPVVVNGAVPSPVVVNGAVPSPVPAVNGAVPSPAVVNGAVPTPGPAANAAVPTPTGAADLTGSAPGVRPELVIDATGVEIRGTHSPVTVEGAVVNPTAVNAATAVPSTVTRLDSPTPLPPATHSGELAGAGELAGIRAGGYETLKVSDLGVVARAVDGRTSPPAPVHQPVRAALDLLSPPVGPSVHTGAGSLGHTAGLGHPAGLGEPAALGGRGGPGGRGGRGGDGLPVTANGSQLPPPGAGANTVGAAHAPGSAHAAGGVDAALTRPGAAPVDAASARSVDPSLAGTPGPRTRPDSAGTPGPAPTGTGTPDPFALPPERVPLRPEPAPTPGPVRPPGQFGDDLTGGGTAPGAGQLDAALDDLTRITAEVRTARENLEIARLGGSGDPLGDAQRIARAEKDLRVTESVQAKITADLRSHGVGDPAAAAAERAWSDYRIARQQLTDARATHAELHPDPNSRPFGEGTAAAGAGKGKARATPAQIQAGIDLDAALVRFELARDRLDDLGLDAVRLQARDDEALRISLIERPRLLGGSRATDARQIGPDGAVHGYGRELANGLRLNLDVPPPGRGGPATEPGAIVDATGTVVFRGEVTELGHGGFRIVDTSGTGRFREYDGSGQLIDSTGGVTLTERGVRLGHLEIDGAGAVLHRPGAAPDRFGYAVAPNSGHWITDLAAGSSRRFDAAGNLDGVRFEVRGANGGVRLGDLEVDFPAGSAVLHRPGQAVPDQFTYQVPPNGGHQVTNAVDGSWRRFDAAGNEVGVRFEVRGANGGVRLGDLEVDFPAGSAVLHRPGQAVPDQFTYQVPPNGGHQVTNAVDGSWRRFDAAGNLIGQRLDVVDQTGAAFGSLRFDVTAGNARHTGPTGTVRNWDNLAIDRNGEIRLSNAHGELQRFSSGGGLREEIIAPRDPRGNVGPTRVHIGLDAAGHQVLRLRRGNADVPNTRVTVDGGGFRITDAGRSAHAGDYRVVGRDGTLHSEQIAFVRRDGRPDGTRFAVDYTTNTWTRLDAGGNRLAAHPQAAPPPAASAAGAAGPPPRGPGYNSGGRVVVKINGDIELIGSGKSPFYSREILGTGPGPRPIVEVFRGTGGKRYWHQWNGGGGGLLGDAGGRGTRDFQDLPEGRLWSDHQHGWPVDRAVREYRSTADGGVIRAEKQADGSWHWYRFDKDGRLTLDGTRDHKWYSTSWKDVYAGPAGPVVAQRYDSAFNPLPKALHYREFGVAPHGNGFRATDSYKEFSPQIKDTASRDVLANNNTLTMRRWAEQRPPDVLWKTPGSVPGPFGRSLTHVLGSELGAVDFPKPGTILGDSRFQVFRWTEADATGAQVATGVRVITTDGSFADFTTNGLFVRGSTKLDNGNTLEIGGDPNAAGKWASLQGNLPAAGPRSLPFREIDAARTVVQNGERTFLGGGRHWVDTVLDPANPQQRLILRHTDADGNVVHLIGQGNRPVFNPAGAHAGPVNPAFAGNTITRNTMGQIVGRQDSWLSDAAVAPGQAPAGLTMRGGGDARKGDWTWNDGAATGTRVSSRNKLWSEAWDDSYRDYRAAGGTQHQIRDLRTLDDGRALAAQRMPDGTWRSVIRDLHGTPDASSIATRQFQHADGTWHGDAPAGTKVRPWRDVDAGGAVLRELVGGRVREYTNPRPANAPSGTGTWKEFDQGAVFRQRVDTGGGVFRETEYFHKQWRETDVNGRLLRYQSLSGTVWERSPLNRWSIQHRDFSLVGREFEFRGLASEFRGKNRMWREANRLQFKAIDGLAGEFVSPSRRLVQKAALDFTQEFILDFSAQVLMALAFNQGNLNPQDWFRALVGAGVASGIKTGNMVLHEVPALKLKGVKDGLANVDGGKDYNRYPYNHDKHWDNEWGGTENPPRWRQSTYDYFQSTIATNFVAAFVANAVNAAAFGLPKDYIPLAGANAALVGAWGGAGTVIVSSVIGGARTLGHNLGSGRYFHRGGAVDIGLSFVERVGERALGTYLMLTALGVRPQDNLSAPPAEIQPPPAPPPA